jgi:hypothetical protein
MWPKQENFLKVFWHFCFVTLFNIVSSAAPKIPLCRRKLGLNPGPVAINICSIHLARSHPALKQENLFMNKNGKIETISPEDIVEQLAQFKFIVCATL